jgi:dihydrolipoamide dehydrogenase
MSTETNSPNSSEPVDLVVIGGGPGGYPCAIRAAQLGAKVVCVENDNLGGTCLNWGCIPTKTMIGSVAALTTIKHAKDFGLIAENVGYDFGAVMARKEKVVKTLVGGVGYLFKKHGVRHAQGKGAFLDANTVEVTADDGTKEVIKAKHVVIATGSVPARIPLPGIGDADVFTSNAEVKVKFAAGTLANGGIWTSNEAVSAKSVPGEMVVIGGGVIGCEFSYTYNGLGTKCTILEMLPRILPTMDKDLSAELDKTLRKQGVTIKTEVKVSRVEDKNGRKAVFYTNLAGEETEIAADVVLVSTGRVAYIDGLGLEAAGVKTGAHRAMRNAIPVNDKMQTNVANVYAIGDVTGGGLAHVATMEGIVAAENICGHPATIDYKAVPGCVYTEPEVAAVGLTEQEAIDKGYDVKVGTFPFRNLGKAMAINERDGFVKVVAEGKYGEILGVHIIGPHATDLIHEAVVSIQLENTVDELMRTIHAHPSLAEALGQANEDVKGLAIDKG